MKVNHLEKLFWLICETDEWDDGGGWVVKRGEFGMVVMVLIVETIVIPAIGIAVAVVVAAAVFDTC